MELLANTCLYFLAVMALMMAVIRLSFARDNYNSD